MPDEPIDCPALAIPVYRRRIYHADTDAGGTVHHARYLAILEEARTEWIAGIEGDELAGFRRGDHAMAVIAVRQRFLKPLRFGQTAEIVSRITEVGKARLAVAYSIFVDGERCHEADIGFACVDLRAERICPVPRSILRFDTTLSEAKNS
ncbi:acyl-CoA thioesterase [Burkholderia cepacia]|uniref:acyl-CoA thioesterase n=1 Tax=Burkholderia cepacia TaxID=292 RepID=UPI00069F9242|nr:thioesterase family protein [Burkholderia cepacia]